MSYTWQDAYYEYQSILRLRLQLANTKLEYVQPWDEARLSRPGNKRKYWYTIHAKKSR